MQKTANNEEKSIILWQNSDKSFGTELGRAFKYTYLRTYCKIYFFVLVPQNYKNDKNYDDIYLHRTIAAVKQNQMLMRAASVQYGVPYSTLNDHIHDKVTIKYGRLQALDDNNPLMLGILCHKIKMVEWVLRHKRLLLYLKL